MGVEMYLESFLTSPLVEMKGRQVPPALLPGSEAVAPNGRDPAPVWTFRSV